MSCPIPEGFYRIDLLPLDIMRIAYHDPLRRLVGKTHARFRQVSI